MRRFALFLVLSASVALVAPFASPEPVLAQEADIVGNWVIDLDRSDNIRDVMERMRRGRNSGGERMSGGGGRGGGGAGGGGRMGGGGRGGDAGQARAPREAGVAARVLQQRIMQQTRDLAITKTDSTYILSTQGAEFGEYFFDGRKLEAGVGSELKFEIKAEWKKTKLQIETKAASGAKLKQKYEIDEDKDELKVELEFSDSRRGQTFKIKLKQIYTRRS